MNLAQLKQDGNQACQSLLTERLGAMQRDLAAIQASANNETKSSAGDKYETGRAMAQLEIEKLTVRITEAKSQLSILANLADHQAKGHIGLGAIVRTDRSVIYLSVSLGKIMVAGQELVVVSTLAPLGKLLVGKKLGDVIIVAGAAYSILEVV